MPVPTTRLGAQVSSTVSHSRQDRDGNFVSGEADPANDDGTRPGDPGVFGSMRMVSICTLLSRILGLARDSAMAALFGNGPLLDAFTLAFRIPNMARVLLGEGVLATAFLPAFVEQQQRHGQQAAFRLATAICVGLTLLLGTVVVLGEAGLLVGMIVLPEASTNRLVVELTAIFLPYVLLVCVTAQLSTVLHAYGRFAWPALLPVLLNALWLAGLGVIGWTIIDPMLRLRATAATVVVAGMVQLAALWPALRRVGFRFEPAWRAAWPEVRSRLAGMGPIVAGLLVLQVSGLIDSFLAYALSRSSVEGTAAAGEGSTWRFPLEEGTASALYFGQRLYQFPLGVFGVALGTVLFPRFTRHCREHSWEALRNDVLLACKLILAIGVPAGVGLFVLAEPLARLFFERGAFTHEDTLQTAEIIRAYGAGVWTFCGIVVLQRAFYAMEDRMTPLRIGLSGVAAGLTVSLGLIWFLGGAGLAWGTTVSGVIQLAGCLGMLHQRIGPLDLSSLRVNMLKLVVCVLAMSLVCILAESLVRDEGSMTLALLRVALPVGFAVPTYFSCAWMIRYEDPWLVLKRSPEATISDVA